ncbi:hypothetical protein AB1N83_001821 [Pleurotus pulmonarius]
MVSPLPQTLGGFRTARAVVFMNEARGMSKKNSYSGVRVFHDWEGGGLSARGELLILTRLVASRHLRVPITWVGFNQRDALNAA